MLKSDGAYHCKVCSSGGENHYFRDGVACDKCGASGDENIRPVVLIHLLVAREGGPIESLGIDYIIPCDEERSYEDIRENGEAVSGVVSSVTCVDCIREIKLNGHGNTNSGVKLESL